MIARASVRAYACACASVSAREFASKGSGRNGQGRDKGIFCVVLMNTSNMNDMSDVCDMCNMSDAMSTPQKLK